MTRPAPVLPDDPHTGDVGHLLLVDRTRDAWWRVWPDGTRTLIGGRTAAEALCRTWLGWADPVCVDGVWLDAEYVGDRYTVRFLADPAELERWPDTTPVQVFR